MNHRTYRSSDGLLSSSDPQAVALWDDIGRTMDRDKANWTDVLRAMGVKLAHPDDGWVKRAHNSFSLSWYPQFNDNPQVGDLIAFGAPPGGEHYRSWHDVWRGRKDSCAREQMVRLSGQPESSADGYRICRVTRVDDRTGVLGRLVKYAYEDTGARVPPPAPTKRWWQRQR